MNKISHIVWFVRWAQRFFTAIIRNKSVIDLCPSIFLPSNRILLDRRNGKFRFFKLRKKLYDYWSYDHCLASSAFDMSKFLQFHSVNARYQEILIAGKTPVILDCGANIGFSSYWFSEEYPQAVIIAVEPDKDNIEYLKLNTRFCKNVKVMEGAISSIDCNMVLTNKEMGSDAFRTVIDQNGPIMGVSVIKLLKMYGYDLENLFLVKIDIEGFESDLFSSNFEWIDSAKAIIVEPHDWLLPGQAKSQNLLRVISKNPRDFVINGEHIISFML